MTKSTNMRNKISGAIAVGIAMMIPFATGGCSSNSVAATVNGEEISEQKITDYVQDFRKTNDLQDDSSWAQWLVDNSRDVDSVRNDAIEYYERIAVIDQDAQSKGIEVTDQDVDDQIQEIKKYYDYDDDKFKEQLENIGYTEESYREYVKESLIEEKLSDATYDGKKKASNKEILKLANSYSTTLNGSKQLKCIVLDKNDTDKAKELQKQAASDPDKFDDLASQNTTSTDYDGWDVLVTEDSAVTTAVKKMNKGDVSDVITGDDNLFIVKVEDVCKVGKKGFKSVKEIPKDLKDQFNDNLTQSDKSSAFETYVQNLIDSADKQTNDKPSGLPYDVSTDGYTPSANSAAAQNLNTNTENGNSSNESNDNNTDNSNNETPESASSSSEANDNAN